nr:G-type lectin S-receptor-like serine/threonine-protein kinase At2g19130 [Ipomoea batatas]
MQTTTLKILDGNLVLVSVTAGLIWSTNATSGASKNSVRATLLNTGNLVLIDGNTTDQPLWQSFDHPTDTIMAGAKFGYNKLTGEKQTLRSWKSPEDPSPGLYSLAMDPQIWQFAATWNGTDRYWTSGPANGSLFKFVPDMRPNPIYNFTFVNNANQTFFVYEFFNPDAVISRFVLDISGQLRHYTWLDSSKAWNILFLKPEKQCDVPAFCGPFGMCNDNSTSLCDCLPGFRRKSDKDWGLNVFTDGCVRIADLQCGNATGTANSQEDKFRMVTNTRLPRHPRNVTVGSTTECESACLRNCSCNAYAYDNRNGGCSHWDGELLNLSKDNSNGSTIYIRLAASEFFVQGKIKGMEYLMSEEVHDERRIDAWKLWKEGKTREFVQEWPIPLEPKHEREVVKCIHISLLCVQERPEDRPRMPTVLTMLNNETCESLSRPNQPAFVPRTSMPSTSTSSSPSGLPHSNNEVTLTVLEGR